MSLPKTHNVVCVKHLRNECLLDILFKEIEMVILNNDRRSNTMEVLVPIVIFGTGIILATILAGLGIQRIVEGEKGNK